VANRGVTVVVLLDELCEVEKELFEIIDKEFGLCFSYIVELNKSVIDDLLLVFLQCP